MTLSRNTLSSIPLIGLLFVSNKHIPYREFKILLHIFCIISLFLTFPLNGISFLLVSCILFFLGIEHDDSSASPHIIPLPNQACRYFFLTRNTTEITHNLIAQISKKYKYITTEVFEDAIMIFYKDQPLCIITENNDQFLLGIPTTLLPVQGLHNFEDWNIHEYKQHTKGMLTLIKSIIKHV